MREQLINFETAKLAKEKGFQRFKFSELVSGEFYFYDKNGYLESNYYKNGSGSKSGAMLNDPIIGAVLSNSCEAPTQSFLQKWLRDEHCIHIIIIPTVTMYWTYKIINLGSELIEQPPYDNVCECDFKTCEEALETALQEALKLI